MQHRLRAHNGLWLGLLFVISLAMRFYYAYGASLWCDEIIWILFGSKNLSHLIHSVRNEYGPLGPFEPFIIALFGKPLIRMGVQGDLAVRVGPGLLASLPILTLLLSKTLSSAEKRIYGFLLALSVPFLAAAITARHPASLLFFSTVSLLAVVEWLRSRENLIHVPILLWFAAIALVPGGLAYPYTLGYSLALFCVGVVTAIRYKSRHWYLYTAAILAGIFIKLIWFKVIRTNDQLVALPWSYTLDINNHNPGYLKELWLFALGGPYASFKVGPFLFLLGIMARWRVSAREVFVLLTIMFVMLCVPYLTSHHYRYSYSPRQALGATPIWLYFQVCGIYSLWWLAKDIQSKLWLRLGSAVLIGIFIVLCVAKPLWHFNRNEPPFTDMPRYDLSWINGVSEGDAIVVLSACQEGSMAMYRNAAITKQTYDHYGHSRGVTAPYADSQRHQYIWTRDVISCSGKIPDEPDDKTLLGRLEQYGWDRVHVLSPANYIVPTSLRKAHCRTETNKPCMYNSVN
jgi:hypothetical protein